MQPPFDITNKKMIIKFKERDPYNIGNELEGFVNRRQGELYGSLWITHVNGKKCYQLIYSAPKQHYPFNTRDEWKFPECEYVDMYEKLDGTCIISYVYKDSIGNVFLTFKTRLRPFLGSSQYGNFFELWNEMLDKYSAIKDYVFDTYHNCIFELYGKRNKILLDYDTPLSARLVFTINATNGQIYPPDDSVRDDNVPMLRSEGVLIDWNDYTLEGMKINYNLIKEDLELQLQIDEKSQVMKGKEGYVMYFMKDGHAIQIKNKPPSVLKYHWSGNAIPYESVYTTVINAFENFDEPTIEDVIELLKEEFEDWLIEKSHRRIERALGKVLFDKKFQYKLAEDYLKLGVDINEDKVTVMRYFGEHYPRSEAKRIYNLLKQYEEGL